jgi:hypothetical protein
MTNDNNNRSVGFYVQYLHRLAKRREERGEAPAQELHDDVHTWRNFRARLGLIILGLEQYGGTT